MTQDLERLDDNVLSAYYVSSLIQHKCFLSFGGLSFLGYLIISGAAVCYSLFFVHSDHGIEG